MITSKTLNPILGCLCLIYWYTCAAFFRQRIPVLWSFSKFSASITSSILVRLYFLLWLWPPPLWVPLLSCHEVVETLSWKLIHKLPQILVALCSHCIGLYLMRLLVDYSLIKMVLHPIFNEPLCRFLCSISGLYPGVSSYVCFHSYYVTSFSIVWLLNYI